MKALERLRRRGLSLRLFLGLTAGLVAIAMLALETLISTQIDSNIIDRRITQIREDDFAQLNSQIDSAIRQVDMIGEKIRTDSALLLLLNRYHDAGRDVYQINRLKDQIQIRLRGMTVGYSSITGFAVAEATGLTISSNALPETLTQTSRMTEIRSRAAATEDGAILNLSPLPAGTTGLEPDPDSRVRLEPLIYAALFAEQPGNDCLLVLQFTPVWNGSARPTDQQACLIDTATQAILWATDAKIVAEAVQLQQNASQDSGRLLRRIGTTRKQVFWQSWAGRRWRLFVTYPADAAGWNRQSPLMYTLVAIVLSLLLSWAIGNRVAQHILRPVDGLIAAARQLEPGQAAPAAAWRQRLPSFRDALFAHYFVVVTIPMLLLALVFYLSSTQTMSRVIRDSFTNTLRGTASDIDSFIIANEQITFEIYQNTIVQETLTRRDEDGAPLSIGELVKVDQAVRANLRDAGTTRVELYDRGRVRIYASTGFDSEQSLNSKFVPPADQSLGNPVWFLFDSDDSGARSPCVVRRIYEIQQGDPTIRTLGYLKLTIDRNRLAGLYSNIRFAESDLFLLDANGIYVSSLKDYRIGELSPYRPGPDNLLRDPRWPTGSASVNLLFQAPLQNQPWILAGEIALGDLTKESSRIMTNDIFLVLSFVLAALVFAYLISLLFARSFNSMARGLAQYAGSSSLNRIDLYSPYSELTVLADTFEHMAVRISDLVQRLISEQKKAEDLAKERNDAEFVALQAQINPHFLANTLESIKWMVEQKPLQAIAMINQLGRLFRFGISFRERFITVAEELEYSRAYVSLQQPRYGSQIEVLWHIDPQIQALVIPKLILQPLIENAFQHGMKNSQGIGSIRIFGYVEGRYLVFKVMDNGQGIEPEKLLRIQADLEGVRRSGNIGIYNVQKRIRLYLGDEYGIRISSHPGRGTIVILTLPVQPPAPEDH